MTDQDALLATILANPADDTPRLVYADWLDEHAEGTCQRCDGKGIFSIDAEGSWQSCSSCHKTGRIVGYAERAEFIRVQCELARMRANPGDECSWGKSDHEGHSGADPKRDPCPRCWPGSIALRRREGELLAVAQSHPDWIGFDCSMVDEWSFRRGFVSSISLTLAQFLGGPCGRCEGRGWHYSHHSHSWRGNDCHQCHGTGRTPGLAPALFAVAPIEEVRLTDREPQEYPLNYGDRAVYGWCQTRPGEPFNLPALLFDELECDDICGVWKDYTTRAAAVDALSAACVAYGREMTKKGRPT